MTFDLDGMLVYGYMMVWWLYMVMLVIGHTSSRSQEKIRAQQLLEWPTVA